MGDRAAHASGMPGIALSIQRLLEAAIPHHACPLGCELEQTGDMYHMLSIALLGEFVFFRPPSIFDCVIKAFDK